MRPDAMHGHDGKPATTPDDGLEVRGAFDTLARGTLLVAGIALVVMAAVEAWQVIARYVLNDSPGWTEPIALLSLNTAMSLGAAVAVHQRRHFGFLLLQQALPPRAGRALEFFSTLVIAALGGVFAGWGLELFVDGFGVRMAGTALPQSTLFLSTAIGGALSTVFALHRAVAIVRTRGNT